MTVMFGNCFVIVLLKRMLSIQNIIIEMHVLFVLFQKSMLTNCFRNSWERWHDRVTIRAGLAS